MWCCLYPEKPLNWDSFYSVLKTLEQHFEVQVVWPTAEHSMKYQKVLTPNVCQMSSYPVPLNTSMMVCRLGEGGQGECLCSFVPCKELLETWSKQDFHFLFHGVPSYRGSLMIPAVRERTRRQGPRWGLAEGSLRGCGGAALHWRDDAKSSSEEQGSDALPAMGQPADIAGWYCSLVLGAVPCSVMWTNRIEDSYYRIEGRFREVIKFLLELVRVVHTMSMFFML